MRLLQLLVCALTLQASASAASFGVFFASTPTDLWQETEPYPDTISNELVFLPRLAEFGSDRRTDYAVIWHWEWRWPPPPEHFLQRDVALRLQLTRRTP